LSNESSGSHINDRISHAPATSVLVAGPDSGPLLGPIIVSIIMPPSLPAARFEDVEDRFEGGRLPLPVATHG